MSQNINKRTPKSPASSAKDSDEGFDRAAYERRRQQVRRAQRNHRERKANYVKALEQEVANLRKQNQHNIREFEEEIQMLHLVVLSYGQQPPTRQARIINPVKFDPNIPSSYTVSKPPGLGQALHLDLPADLSSLPMLDQSSSQGQYPGLPAAGRLEPLVPIVGMPSTDLSFGSVPLASQQTLPQLMDRVHGINFVLSLEYPCMAHPDVARDQFGTHSHMATHNLLVFAPTEVCKAESWEVPGTNVERLMALGNSFQLEGEITPVQAWYRLKQHPRFPVMEPSQLERLRSLLVVDAKCHGFGAVIDEQIWSLALEEVFMTAH